MATEFIRATGRRKTAIARVRLVPKGDGSIEINDQSMEQYFPRDVLRMQILRPLVLTEKAKGVSLYGRVHGGGIAAQAGALAHGISRALIKLDAGLRPVLKKEGLLTRDPRMKERKKYGQKGARKRFQFSKR
ncbi:MAG: 30S ribosomal protein S9 [Proteobacteria bacterium]|nr:30S ribosomal protein S9 [Pseudomonadota bacterium]NDC25877.1 30S ribosomal protein S9 [Pseudomonadota bacterium]NDD04807.1 30S ribosomal protein S9 [Pseudomonadota bacterium]NDG27950.1 30S ribosomal protein S9 [Pseudomonadota bacterium]